MKPIRKILSDVGASFEIVDRVAHFPRTGTVAHYWYDGMIMRRDLYILNGDDAVLESAWYRYDSYRAWRML